MPCEECGHWEHGAGDHYYCALLEMRQECCFESKGESTLMFANKPKDESTTQMKTQNSNLTFEKDECAKEYEELGLKELKELIEADRKTEPQKKYPTEWCEECDLWREDNCMGVAQCKANMDALIKLYEASKDEPMKTTDYCDICKRDMCEDCIADATNPYCVPSHYEINYEPKDEPQTDCAWK